MDRIKVLAVTPDPVMRSFLEDNLGQNKYQLATTRHTGEMLQGSVDDERPDIILLDIMMPDLDGIPVCLRLRQITEKPIIMVSTWGAGDGNIRGLDLSALSYLTEPFGINKLEGRIQEVLFGDPASNNLVPSASRGSS